MPMGHRLCVPPGGLLQWGPQPPQASGRTLQPRQSQLAVGEGFSATLGLTLTLAWSLGLSVAVSANGWGGVVPVSWVGRWGLSSAAHTPVLCHSCATWGPRRLPTTSSRGPHPGIPPCSVVDSPPLLLSLRQGALATA